MCFRVALVKKLVPIYTITYVMVNSHAINWNKLVKWNDIEEYTWFQ